MRSRLFPSAVVGCVLAFASSTTAQQPRRVLFVLGDGQTSVDPASLRAAVEAQLAGTDAEVVFAQFYGAPSTLREQVASARALAAEHGVAAAFWLDTTDPREWLFYLAERDGERILVRRIDVENAAAGTEAVGVITSRSTEALFSGRTIGLQPVTLDQKKEVSPFDEPPKPAPPPRPPPPVDGPPGPLRVAVGYRGSSYSTEIPWQQGASFGAYWLSPWGPYGGIALASTASSVAESNLVTIDLRRTGGEAALGWRFRIFPIALDAELLYAGEIVSRSVVGARSELVEAPPSSRWQSSVGAQLRGEFAVTRALGVYVGGGMHLVLNDFQSIAVIDGENRAILDPFKARWVAAAGLTVWP